MPADEAGRLATMTRAASGTATLFAAPDILDGTVIGRDAERRRSVDFIAFLDRTEATAPPEPGIHAILGNCAARKTAAAKELLETHPRRKFHPAPTSCSRLNTVEGFFGRPTCRRLRRSAANPSRRSRN